MLKRRHFTALAGATALSAPMVARGQARWKPEKPITIYNPFAAGGVTDVHIRMLGETVTKVLGQQVIVDVKAGAAGTLGAGHAGQRQAGRPDARLHEHQQPALSALSEDQLGSAEGLHLHQRAVGLHHGHRREVDGAVADARGPDRRRQEGAREVQFRHLGHRRHRPAHDDRGRSGDRRQVHARSLQGRCGMDAGAAERPGAFPGRRLAMGAVRRQRPVPHPRARRPSSASRNTRTCRP